MLTCCFRIVELDMCLHLLSDIQRKWVYLEPIFGRGALPAEAARFNRVDVEMRVILDGSDLIITPSLARVQLTYVNYILSIASGPLRSPAALSNSCALSSRSSARSLFLEEKWKALCVCPNLYTPTITETTLVGALATKKKVFCVCTRTCVRT